MNYYKLTFDSEMSVALRIFQRQVAAKYFKNSWSSPDIPLYVIATNDTPEQVAKQIDLSNDPIGSGFAGAEKLNLKIEKISAATTGLPKEASDWLAHQVQIVDDMRAFIEKYDKPT